MSKLKKVYIISKEDNKKPKFIKTQLIKAKRGDGEEFFWESTKQMDSVHILVDNIETKEIMLVKQVRIPVLINDDEFDGEVFELCAGLVDKDCSIKQIAKEEVLEEMGYDVETNTIKEIKKLKSAVGTSGANSYSFTVDVTEDMKVSKGGGLDNEDIEIVRIPYSEVNNFLNGKSHTDAITMFVLTRWTISNLLKKD